MLSYDMGPDARGPLGLYEYLYRRIRDDIVSGAIGPEERLPSKRALANNLDVSLATVEGALSQLVAEGYVEARPRRGYFARRLPSQVRAAVAFKPSSPQPVGPALSSAAGASLSSAAGAPGASPSPAPLADFTRPTLRSRVPVANLWGRTLRAVLAQESEGELYAPAPPQGSLRLRQDIATHLRGSRGIVADPGQIVVGAGAQVLYGMVVQMLGHGLTYAVEDPGYPRLSNIYRAQGVRLAHIGLDGEGVAMDAVRASGADVVHLMPSHQFPTGIVTSIARRYELLAWAAARPGRYLVEDDYDCEFRLAGRPIPSLSSFDSEGRVIYVGTFSKSLSSALRMAYLVVPPALFSAFDQKLGCYSSTVSTIDQVALARLLESGDYERHVARYRNAQREVRDDLVAALRDRLSEAVEIREADSGLHFVMCLHTRRTEAEVARRAAEAGVLLPPLSSFAQDPANLAGLAGGGRGAGGAARVRGDGPARAAGPAGGDASIAACFVMQYEGCDPATFPQVAQVIAQAAGL